MVIFDEDHIFCSVFLKGETGNEANLCDDSKKEDVEKLQKGYETILSDIGISENEFKKFIEWYAEDEGVKFIDNLAEKQKKQEVLKPAEVQSLLSKNFKIKKVNDGITLTDSLDFNTIMFLDSDVKSIVFKSKLYEDLRLYQYEDDRNIVMSVDLKCKYSLDDEKIIENSNCTKEQVSDASMLQSAFEKILAENRITSEEFFNFLNTYSK